MSRSYYQSSIPEFLQISDNQLLGELTRNHQFDLNDAQRNSWITQIQLLKSWVSSIEGSIIFEYTIPRIGKRIDCVILSGGIIFAVEFKVGSDKFDQHAIDQVFDYSIDLKNFHEWSHDRKIVPILISTRAQDRSFYLNYFQDNVARPILTNGNSLTAIIEKAKMDSNEQSIDLMAWSSSRYKPTPTIVEAAQALYSKHSAEDITRSDAGAENLSRTASAITEIIESSRRNNRKSICFLTGVPGAGKTLAGLDLANRWHNPETDEHAVFLSGNWPLVSVLQEALARDKVKNSAESNVKITKSSALQETKVFIQNVHHFRDEYFDNEGIPIERVVIFDEAQRAWDSKMTSDFMKRKKGNPDFNKSEPEFLISVLDRHPDWATIVCLIGGGQEINTGEAGLREWFESIVRAFPDWDIHISNKLTDSEYAVDIPKLKAESPERLYLNDDLHLAVSIRSFRSEKVSALVKAMLDCDIVKAKELNTEIQSKYPIKVTRNLELAKKWLKDNARGTERSGVLASSWGLRLKPCGITVKSAIDPAVWFLNDKQDVRSSYFLEDVATEFDVQGLELDWACVAWDANYRFADGKWETKSFTGTKWQEIRSDDKKLYLRNSYRVLLTRARQGMVIYVPYWNNEDQTRKDEFYDGTYEYFKLLGLEELI